MLILASTVTGCVSISVFGSLFCFPVGIANSDVRIKSLQKLKSISELQKKEETWLIMLLGKTKLDTTELIFSRPLIDWYISNWRICFSK